MNGIHRFQFKFAPAYRLGALAFGVKPSTAWVEVGEKDFDAHFGPWRVRTPLANIKDVAVTGPYRYAKTAGPARLAITDRGLTFATNGDLGARVSFTAPVRGLERFGRLRHPELTVTVADVNRLVSLLEDRGVPVRGR